MTPGQPPIRVSSMEQWPSLVEGDAVVPCLRVTGIGTRPRVLIPPVPPISGRSAVWQRSCLGRRRSEVRVLSSRPNPTPAVSPTANVNRAVSGEAAHTPINARMVRGETGGRAPAHPDTGLDSSSTYIAQSVCGIKAHPGRWYRIPPCGETKAQRDVTCAGRRKASRKTAATHSGAGLRAAQISLIGNHAPTTRSTHDPRTDQSPCEGYGRDEDRRHRRLAVAIKR